MELGDALTISALGMGVVFGGLSLTALLILLVGRLPQAAARLRALRRRREPAPRPGSPALADPAVVAVIAAALEVERRLHHAEAGRRLTIERVSESPRGQT